MFWLIAFICLMFGYFICLPFKEFFSSFSSYASKGILRTILFIIISSPAIFIAISMTVFFIKKLIT